MGTEAEVHVVDGDPALLLEARAQLDRLEARWSRFRPESDISAISRAAGAWVPVAPETIVLLQHAVVAARATDGRFDPTVGSTLIAHGYDRTFPEVARRAADLDPVPAVDGSWPAIEIDPLAGAARVLPETVLDVGAIGKGLAADLVVRQLAPQAAGVLVNLGGDLRLSGRPPDEEGWVISIDDPFRPGEALGRFALAEGAVATSSRVRRRWGTRCGPAHHIIDPATGRPAQTEVVAVTTVAAEAWWAEVQATSLFLLGPDGLASAPGSVQALLVLADGRTVATDGLREVA
jgi:thiamine biosynthesis lipoprotein